MVDTGVLGSEMPLKVALLSFFFTWSFNKVLDPWWKVSWLHFPHQGKALLALFCVCSAIKSSGPLLRTNENVGTNEKLAISHFFEPCRQTMKYIYAEVNFTEATGIYFLVSAHGIAGFFFLKKRLKPSLITFGTTASTFWKGFHLLNFSWGPPREKKNTHTRNHIWDVAAMLKLPYFITLR